MISVDIKQLYKRHLKKGIITFLASGIIIFGCTNDEKSYNYLTPSEKIVDSIYSHTFVGSDFPVKFETIPNPINLYETIEDYFVFIGVLKTRDQEGYKTMCNHLLVKELKVDLKCLYKYYPEIQLLTLPSIVTANYYGFEIASKNEKILLSEKSSILIADERLQKMRNGYNINFDEQAFREYIDSIDSSDFENKFIYRIPILAFLHILLSEGTLPFPNSSFY